MPIKDLPGYYPTIKDGGLGVLPPSLAGLFCLIGTSEKGDTKVQFAGDMDDVFDEYGLGILSEHAYDNFASGASQIGLVRATATKVTTDITTPAHKVYGDPTGGGEATVATGYVSPHTLVGGNRRYRLRIVKGGSFDTASFQVSLNNGLTWEAERSFDITTAGPPRKSKIEMENGTYIEFTEAGTPANSFVAGDEYWWWCYEPRASLDEIIAACQRAIAWKDPNTGQGFEYIYVANLPASVWGTRNSTNIQAFHAALITLADMLWNDEQRPIFFLTNSAPMLPMKDADSLEEISDWIDLLVECSGAQRSERLIVNAGYASLLDGRGNLRVRSAGGSAAGLVANAELHHSIGWVRYMRIPNSVAVYPYKPPFFVNDENLGTGDGSKKIFTGFLAEAPVLPWSVVITSNDTTPEVFVDGGDEILYDSTTGAVSGWIRYATGEYSVTFVTAPAASKIVSADYEYETSAEMNKSNLARLNDARYLCLRHWIGYGIRFVDDYTMASATSDYFCIRNRRIVDEAVRQVGIANAPYVNSPGITEKDMAAYKADLSRPLEAMKITDDDTDKPIMDYTLVLTPDPNIWSNGIVKCKVEIIPTPTKKKLEATFQLRTKLD